MVSHTSDADDLQKLFPYMQGQIFESFEDPPNRQKLANRHEKHNLFVRPLREASCVV